MSFSPTKKCTRYTTNFEHIEKLNFGEQFVYENFNFNITKDSTYFNSSKIGNTYYFYKTNLTSIAKSYTSKLNYQKSVIL